MIRQTDGMRGVTVVLLFGTFQAVVFYIFPCFFLFQLTHSSISKDDIFIDSSSEMA